MRRTPLRPSRSPVQKTSLPSPSGDTTPRPVTATRRTLRSRALGDETTNAVDDLPHRLHRLRRLVGHDDPERIFEGEQQIRRVEGIDAELLEGAVERHGGRVELALLGDDRHHLRLDRIGHESPSGDEVITY